MLASLLRICCLQCRADHDWEAVAAGPDTAVIDVREPGELKAVRRLFKKPAVTPYMQCWPAAHRMLLMRLWPISACPSLQLSPCHPSPNLYAPATCPALQTGSIPGALNLPISAIRGRLEEVPKNKKLYVHCAVSS